MLMNSTSPKTTLLARLSGDLDDYSSLNHTLIVMFTVGVLFVVIVSLLIFALWYQRICSPYYRQQQRRQERRRLYERDWDTATEIIEITD